MNQRLAKIAQKAYERGCRMQLPDPWQSTVDAVLRAYLAQEFPDALEDASLLLSRRLMVLLKEIVPPTNRDPE